MQFSIIFIDSEGSPLQELSAIELDVNTLEIMDVYHEYAKCNETDSWARRNIHGLSLDFLDKHGHSTSDELINSFKNWLKTKHIMHIYANNPSKEKQFLQRTVYDIGLPVWIDRIKLASHILTQHYKRLSVPILKTSCNIEAHSSYKRHVLNSTNPTECAKANHGYHCSLYDCYELYLFYLMSLGNYFMT